MLHYFILHRALRCFVKYAPMFFLLIKRWESKHDGWIGDIRFDKYVFRTNNVKNIKIERKCRDVYTRKIHSRFTCIYLTTLMLSIIKKFCHRRSLSICNGKLLFALVFIRMLWKNFLRVYMDVLNANALCSQNKKISFHSSISNHCCCIRT